MWHDVVTILVILILGGLVYFLNNVLNPNAKAKSVIGYVILAVCALLLISPLVDAVREALSNVHS